MKKSTKFFAKGSVERKWYIIDASNKVLGRLATKVADMLRGKNKPQFSPNADLGDFVIIVNADKVLLTGAKLTQKHYKYYTGYQSGLKEIRYDKLMSRKPELAIQQAVKRMLPKNKLNKVFMKKLKIYKGLEHPHAAQKPEFLDIN